MPKKIVIVTENMGSQSIKRLAAKLTEKVGYKVLRVKPGRERKRQVVQFPRGIAKDLQFVNFADKGVTCPKFTKDKEQAKSLIDTKTGRIVARQLLNSSSGKGISIHDKDADLPNAPLYVQYVPKKKEYRVHVYNNAVIDVAEKRKRKGHEGDRDTQVRNLANGYVFCRDNITEPSELRELAVNACKALGRSQGAVDVIWNEKQGKCYVLEVNSNPGMEGTTLEKYANAILGVNNA